MIARRHERHIARTAVAAARCLRAAVAAVHAVAVGADDSAAADVVAAAATPG